MKKIICLSLILASCVSKPAGDHLEKRIFINQTEENRLLIIDQTKEVPLPAKSSSAEFPLDNGQHQFIFYLVGSSGNREPYCVYNVYIKEGRVIGEVKNNK